MAILSGGTVNDFVTAMEIPTEVEEFVTCLKAEKTKNIDVGVAGNREVYKCGRRWYDDRYSIQCFGKKKDYFGRAAYYVEALKEVVKLGDKKKKTYF